MINKAIKCSKQSRASFFIFIIISTVFFAWVPITLNEFECRVWPWFSQVTLWSGSCGSVSLQKVAGSLLTTLTRTRSACRTVDEHGRRNTLWFFFKKLTYRKCEINMTNESCVPATSGAVIPAAQSRFGLWSWVMQASTTSGLRQTSHWGDGPPLTPSSLM